MIALDFGLGVLNFDFSVTRKLGAPHKVSLSAERVLHYFAIFIIKRQIPGKCALFYAFLLTLKTGLSRIDSDRLCAFCDVFVWASVLHQFLLHIRQFLTIRGKEPEERIRNR